MTRGLSVESSFVVSRVFTHSPQLQEEAGVQGTGGHLR